MCPLQIVTTEKQEIPIKNRDFEGWRWDSNPQPIDYKSIALPIELRQHLLNIFSLFLLLPQPADYSEKSGLLYQLSYATKFRSSKLILFCFPIKNCSTKK